jgi:hypothetical protein
VLDRDYPQAHFNLGLRLLAMGRYQEGWEEQEWRWKCKDFTSPQRHFSKPQWDGEPLEDRTILLHAEQGFGDTLQFIRYLPLMARRAGRVIVECQAELERLLRPSCGSCEIVPKGQPLPDFDVHCPLLSLPRIFGATMDASPVAVPYLVADPARVEAWRKKLSLSSGTLNVALAWAGNPGFKGDRTRSTTLDRLAALAKVRGVNFYSIQKGEPARQLEHPPAGMRVVDLGPELHDFCDTAAVMAVMDLVLTTDTSVAHLAGALGRPVWVMLQFAPDWRWLIGREDCPWYPSMRLFRQRSRGDWPGVVDQIAGELALGRAGK